MEALIEMILAVVPDRPRAVEGEFLMSVDHCFAIKGHGTVLTGTVLQVRIHNHEPLKQGNPDSVCQHACAMHMAYIIHLYNLLLSSSWGTPFRISFHLIFAKA